MQSSKDQIQTLKDKAAQNFKTGDFLKALNLYEDVLHILVQREQDIKDLLEKDKNIPQATIDQYNEEVSVQKAIIFNNLAMCHFKRNEIEESNYYNKRCLQIDNKYIKAHYRKIQILMQKQKYVKALDYTTYCLKQYQDKSFSEILRDINQKLSLSSMENDIKQEIHTFELQILDQLQNKQLIEKRVLDLNIYGSGLDTLLFMIHNTDEKQKDHSFTSQTHQDLLLNLMTCFQQQYNNQVGRQDLNLLLKVKLNPQKNAIADIILNKESDSPILKYLKVDFINKLAMSQKGRDIIQNDLEITLSKLTQQVMISNDLEYRLDIKLQTYSLIAKLISNKKTDDPQLCFNIYKEFLQLFQEYTLNQNISQDDILIHQQRVETLMDCYVYFSLKYDFKQLLMDKYKYFFKSFMESICNQNNLKEEKVQLYGIDKSMKSQFIFILLNLIRSQDYDLIPSFTYSKKEKLREMDMSYYELKELRKTLSNSRQLYAQLNQDYVNEYGIEEEVAQNIRNALIIDCELFGLIKSLREYLKFRCGVVVKKMITEIILQISYQKNLVPLLVSNTLAKVFIYTNPNLIHDHTKYEAITLLVHTLVNERVHHELLLFEGLLALTNISSSDEELREKQFALIKTQYFRILNEGGWDNAKSMLFEKNLQIVIAAIELMSNLALTSTIQSRISSDNCKIELESILSWFNQEHSNEKVSFAVLSFLANSIELENSTVYNR
ncbi:e3 ubiquitin-protein ligase chip [Stylonychia lemnae]|uniref:E3 ubiquitin-protein ligase chip n=1 Tax=Stylonychia lemnae TaxID=5949 RepID=A0A078AIZ5_STYLE|nr:e3 ubiquitin-protein ligase chip [Stylonychia lemnae]|eukprot:CDW80778.1 e3 ubiquitin-protein ligase chip [Stylonychia lemnae]